MRAKILDRAANSAEVVLRSNSPIHFNTSSTSTEDNAHLAFLLQQFSCRLLLFLNITQPFFVSAFCPLSAQSWVWQVQDFLDFRSLNHHSAPWYIYIFPVLDWDPEQWLIILTHHPSIHQERCAGVDVLWQKVREVFPVPGGPITRSIAPLIDNERGSVDDKGFAKDGVWGAGLPASMRSQLVDRLLRCRSDYCCFLCLLVHLRWTIARYWLVAS